MKFRRFYSAISIALIAVSENIMACGPFAPLIPTPEFFEVKREKRMSDYDREENLRLWQQLTSPDIPLSDIERVVYGDADIYDYNIIENRFYVYLRNSNDGEIEEFLRTAKDLEKRRSETESPWYYPKSREVSWDTGDYRDIIEFCKGYQGKRLKDRYALQTVRAIFASRCYEECIEYYDSVFSDIPDSNLMKRMAGRYVAGCWMRLGDVARADSAFAQAGDIWSVSADDKVAFMAELNPNAPQIIEYIRNVSVDSVRMNEILPTAMKLMKRRKVINKGDWAFLAAYCQNEFNGNIRQARRLIHRALNDRFSTDELRDLARAYRMKLDAQSGDRSSLLADLRWIEKKCDILDPDAKEWVRRAQNIIYADWIPQLWEKRDYSTAILLCGYADNLVPIDNKYPGIEPVYSYYCAPSYSVPVDEMRASQDRFNYRDYGCLSFQLMGSLSSGNLIEAYGRMKESNPLNDFLRRNMRTDRDYYNELIGTLALREENYSRAIQYLSAVSLKYQRTMNVYKCKFLRRDPFAAYPSQWEEYSGTTSYPGACKQDNAKLNFARKMFAYKQLMVTGKSADRRGLARLMYAIGRRSSFEECWALTQYWNGWVDKFYPSLEYWDEEFAGDNYPYLYEYDPEPTEELYKREVKAALAMLESDEARAQAEYILGNLKTVVKRYGNTRMASHIKTSCDHWKLWV